MSNRERPEMQRMSIDHLKRCQEIAMKTGGKELAAAIAKALSNRKEPTR